MKNSIKTFAIALTLVLGVVACSEAPKEGTPASAASAALDSAAKAVSMQVDSAKVSMAVAADSVSAKASAAADSMKSKTGAAMDKVGETIKKAGEKMEIGRASCRERVCT